MDLLFFLVGAVDMLWNCESQPQWILLENLYITFKNCWCVSLVALLTVQPLYYTFGPRLHHVERKTTQRTYHSQSFSGGLVVDKNKFKLWELYRKDRYTVCIFRSGMWNVTKSLVIGRTDRSANTTQEYRSTSPISVGTLMTLRSPAPFTSSLSVDGTR